MSNSEVGIDLGGDCSTTNDPGDAEAGANGLLNKPVLTSAKTVGGKTNIQGGLNSTPRDPFVVEFFPNPAGANEGKRFIDDKAVSTDSNGNVSFTFVPSQAVAAGQRITATATNVVEANTPEFSGAETLVAR